jgi:hypothetical protein
MTRHRIVLATVVALAIGAVPAFANAPAPTTELVGVSSSGKPANCQDIDGSISGDGRFVVFNSCATNLVANSGAPWAQTYLRNRTTGKTSLLSKNGKGVPADRDALHPVISHTGRYVVLTSAAGNLAGANKAGTDVVLRLDRNTGAYTRVSVAPGAGAPNEESGLTRSAISDNGRFVAFTSRATDLVNAHDTNNADDVYLRDMQRHKTVLVSKAMDGTAAGGGGDMQITGDGRYVVFTSESDNLVPDSSGFNAFIYDRVSNKLVSLSRNAVFNSFGQYDGQSPTIAGDGSEACFVGSGGAGDLKYQIWCTSLHYAGGVPQQPTTYTKVTAVPDGPDGDSSYPVLSRHGDWVAFTSAADNLAGSDHNKAGDVYLAKIGGSIQRASVTSAGNGANQGGGSATVDVSDTGRNVLFDSSSTNLVAKDKNGAPDLFVRTR